jgi:hypothetical protein
VLSIASAAILVAITGCGSDSDDPTTAAVEQPTTTLNPLETLTLTCGNDPFTAWDLDTARNTTIAADDPAFAALVASLGQLGPELDAIGQDQWVPLVLQEGRVTFANQNDGGVLVTVVVERGADGTWAVVSSGTCVPRRYDAGRVAAAWTTDTADLSPDSTGFTALVSAPVCAGGQPAADRIAEPVISYRPDAVTLIFYVEPVEGAQTCPDAPPTPYEVELSEPLGDRVLFDDGTWPPTLVSADS